MFPENQDQTDENQGTDPSAAPQNDDVNPPVDTSTAEPTTDDNLASDTSTDTGVKENQEEKPKPTIAERIAQGLKKLSGEDETSTDGSPPEESKEEKDEASEQKTQDQKPEEKDSEEDKASDEEQKADENWHKHPASKKVIAERKQARQEARDLKQQLEQVQPVAESHEKLNGFLQENNISNAEAAEALQLTALARKDPQAFYQKLTELQQVWGQHLGEVLPADLQKEVEEGYMTKERAQELARTRGQNKVLEGAKRQAEERSTQATQQVTQQQEMQYRQQLFEKWHENVAQSDPDLERKMPFITDRLYQILANEGDPKDANEAWSRLERAHKEVSNTLKTYLPPKQPKEPSPRSTGTSGAKQAQPQNYEQAMAMALDNLGGA